MRECFKSVSVNSHVHWTVQKRFAVVLSIHRCHEVSPLSHPISLTNTHNYSMLYVICKARTFMPNPFLSLTNLSIQGT